MHFILIPDWEGIKVPSYFLSPFCYMSSKVRKMKKRGGKSREERAPDPFMPFFFFFFLASILTASVVELREVGQIEELFRFESSIICSGLLTEHVGF